ncbi:MAG: fumarate reductase subunit FrdD [Acidimicrobiia bacterium]
MRSPYRTTDPLAWLLFSAGGVVSAFLFPVTIVLTGLAIPAGLLSEESLLALIKNPLVRLYLLVLISLPLFHWAHRFRYALVDLGFGTLGRQKVLFYGTAALGTLLAGYFLLRL